MAHAFADLGSLSEDENRCNVDRMILFSTFREKRFTAEEARRWLARAGATVPMSEISAGGFDEAIAACRDPAQQVLTEA